MVYIYVIIYAFVVNIIQFFKKITLCVLCCRVGFTQSLWQDLQQATVFGGVPISIGISHKRNGATAKASTCVFLSP